MTIVSASTPVIKSKTVFFRRRTIFRVRRGLKDVSASPQTECSFVRRTRIVPKRENYALPSVESSHSAQASLQRRPRSRRFFRGSQVTMTDQTTMRSGRLCTHAGMIRCVKRTDFANLSRALTSSRIAKTAQRLMPRRVSAYAYPQQLSHVERMLNAKKGRFVDV